LENPGIYAEKDLAFFDHVPFLIVLADKVTGDLGPYDGVDGTVRRGDPLHVNRDIPLDNIRHLHARWLRSLGFRLSAAGGAKEEHWNDYDRNEPEE
jgi:hypothetical protein